MRPEDVYDLTGVADPRVSPDGSLVAFVVWRLDREANEQRSTLWVVRADGSDPPRQVTFGESRDADPRWSPDGRWLAFTSKRDGHTMQLFVMPVGEPGEPRKLTDHDEDVEQPAWSPDGTRIAFASRVRDPAYEEEDEKKRRPRRITRLRYRLDTEGWVADRPRHLFVVPVEGAEPPRQVTHGDAEDERPSWSPDGTRIAFASARHEDWDVTPINDVYTVAADGSGDPELLTGMDGWCSAPSWSPDGGLIAYLFTPGVFDEPRHGQVAVVDVASGERRLLTSSLDRNCAPYPELREPVWEPGGEGVLFALEDRGTVPLYRVAADGSSAPEQVLAGDFCVTGFDAAGAAVAHVRSAVTSLPELWVGERRLTSVGGPFAETCELVDAEPFTATSADGGEVQAWIARPAGSVEGERYPLVLNVHGGPFTQYGRRFFDEFQVEAGAGYAVVFSNPRGSSGYTEEWGRAIRGPADGGPGWGSLDYEDVMAVVDTALERFDFLDPDRVAVMGGSYGGYMTSWIVGHTDRFRCAISERGVSDMAALDLSSDWAGFLKGYMGAYSWEDPEAYRRVSPIAHAARITTPLLILHSEDDLRCPAGQADALFTVLRSLKREVELVRFPKESHELSRSGSPAHRVMRFQVVLEWLDRHLKPQPEV